MNTQDKLAESLRKLADDWHDALPEITASDCIQELRDEIEAYAGETSQSQVQSAEWVLVPREPTDGMLQAAEDAVDAASNCESTTDDLSAIAYKAALAAAPQPQTAEPFMYTWSKEPDKDGVFRKIPLYTHPQPVQDAKFAPPETEDDVMAYLQIARLYIKRFREVLQEALTQERDND